MVDWDSGNGICKCLVFCAVLLGSRDALAFRTSSDLPELQGTERVRFAADLVSYELFEGGAPGVSEADLQSDMIGAFGAWSAPGCSGIRFNYSGMTASRAQPGDNRNTIEWIASGWDVLGYDPQAAAVTDVQYLETPGAGWVIAEADIYLNATNHTWSARGGSSEASRDVLSVLTHEVGHFLGLLHPCEPGGVDGAPDCSADGSFAETTMYPFYDPEQASLSPDDEAGVCFLYPSANCAMEGCPSGLQCTPDGCRLPCGAELCDPAEVCFEDRCVELGDCGAVECSPHACTSDVECIEPARCIDGSCDRGAALAGDPCVDSGDCADGTCASDGYCATSCVSDSQCGQGQQCETSSGEGLCVGNAPLGATCEEANQCIGNECLAGAGDSAVCTRACGAQLTPCPLGWECATVETRSVCVPPQTVISATGAGCACSTSSTGHPALAEILAFCALGAFVRQRLQGRRPSAYRKGNYAIVPR